MADHSSTSNQPPPPPESTPLKKRLRLRLHLLAFSKDRPFQLGEALRSLRRHLRATTPTSAGG